MPAPERFEPDRPEGRAEKVAACLQRVIDAEKVLADIRCSLLDLGQTADASGITSTGVGTASVPWRTAGSMVSEGPRHSDSLNNRSLDALITSQASSPNTKPEEKSKQRVRPSTGEEELDIVKEQELRRYARSHGIPAATALQCYRIFRKADVNNSGKIDVNELRPLLNKLHDWEVDEQEVNKVLRLVDRNKDNELDFDEFMHVFGNAPLARLESRIEHMGQEAREEMDDTRMSTAEKIRQHGVRRSKVKNWIEKEMLESEACMRFPAALALFCAFCLMVFTHYPVEELHAIDKAITYDIQENANFAFAGIAPFENGRMGHKNFQDVNTIADFWSWLNLGIVPLFWAEGWDVSEVRTNVAAKCKSRQAALLSFGGYNETWLQAASQTADFSQGCPEGQDTMTPPSAWYGSPVTPTYLYYHTVVGGLRLRQERVNPVECPNNDLRRNVHSGLCVPDVGHWLRPELQTGLFFDPDLVNVPGGETVYLRSSLSQREIREQLRALENRAWFDPLTVKVEMLHTTYNAHMGVVTAAFMLIFVNPGGHFFKIIEPVSIYVDPYPHWWSYVPDIAWVVLVMKVVIEEGYEIYLHMQEHGQKGLRVYLSQPTNALDCFCVIFSAILWIMWGMHLSALYHLQDLLTQADVAVPGSWTDESLRIEFFEHVEDLVTEVFVFRWMLAVYPTVIVARFFKAFSAQPRLAMVTQTLSRASIDIAHFGTVFSCIFVIYASSAMILFGQEIYDFANFGRALNTTFRIMLGDFEWDEMNHVGRLQAGVWFWSFTWLVNLIMLNMLLAVIMDVYTEVKGSIGSGAETMWSQSVEIFTRWRGVQAGTWVPLKHVLTALEAGSSGTDGCREQADGVSGVIDPPLFVQQMRDILPNMTEEQALQILSSSQELQDHLDRPPESLTDATLKIGHIQEMVEVQCRSLESLIEMCEMNSNLVVNTSRTERAESRHDKKATKQAAAQSNTINGAMLRMFEDSIRQQIEPILRQLSEMSKIIERQAEVSSGKGTIVTRTRPRPSTGLCEGVSRCPQASARMWPPEDVGE